MNYTIRNKDGILVLFGNLLRFYRRQVAKINIEDLSEIMSLNTSYLRLLESGTNALHSRHSLKLALYLECDVTTLLFFMSFMSLTEEDRSEIIKTKLFDDTIPEIKNFNIEVHREEYQKVKTMANIKIIKKLLTFLKFPVHAKNKKEMVLALHFINEIKKEL